MPNPYHRAMKGPDLTGAFEVQAGIVGIESADGLSLALPPGSLWPGLSALPPTLADALQLSGSLQTPGTITAPVSLTSRELKAALAFLGSVRLYRGRLSLRFTALAEVFAPRGLNHAVVACLIGSTRESVSKALGEWADPRGNEPESVVEECDVRT